MSQNRRQQSIVEDLSRQLPLDDADLDLLLRKARTHSGWHDRPVPTHSLKELWDLIKVVPTAVNSMPARILFLTSQESKERLKACLSHGNIEKTMSAPVTALIGYDSAFWQQMPKLFPNEQVQTKFRQHPQHGAITAFRNSCLQGAWLILAARVLGLDCGPMFGFDEEAVDREFFRSSSIHSNFLCNIGYGDSSKLYPRLPRLSFDETCSIL